MIEMIGLLILVSSPAWGLFCFAMYEEWDFQRALTKRRAELYKFESESRP